MPRIERHVGRATGGVAEADIERRLDRMVEALVKGRAVDSIATARLLVTYPGNLAVRFDSALRRLRSAVVGLTSLAPVQVETASRA